MEKKILSIVLLLFTTLLFSQEENDKSEGYHKFTERGITVEGYYTKDEKKTGHWNYKDKAGNLKREENYNENGQLHGEVIDYRKGNVSETIPYVNGKKEGVGKLYHNPDTEAYSHERHYKNDKVVYLKGFYTNGNIHEEHFLEPGTQHYKLYYDQSGKVIHKAVYNIQGLPIGIHKLIFLEGNTYRINHETHYDDKSNHVKTVRFSNPPGSYTESYFRNDKLHGVQTVYNSNTKEKKVTYFFDGNRVTENEFKELSKKQKP